MFLELLDFLTSIHSGFGVLGYLTTRSAFALITALVLTLILGNSFIALIKKMQFGQIVRDDGPQTHLQKQGTPTMGGVLITFALVVSSLFWGNLSNPYLWIVLFSAFSFMVLGFIDDYQKVSKKTSDGLSAKIKFLVQSALTISIIYLLLISGLDFNYLIPAIKNYSLELGVFAFVVLSFLLINGFSNAVNLTDGLDGLAIMPIVIIASGLAIYGYISSNYNFSTHLYMIYMPHSTEMLIILASLIGAGLGFLWFNTYPAQVFMGDSGSLSLGAVLIVVAIILRQEIIFILMSLVFIAEMFSVIIQVASFKLRSGKRVFLMAPLHHHFEQKGMSEPKIIVRAWLITLLLVLIALAFIKIR
jgi:phospho-N-acetylmuramoyl-pentapeptide-transferase